jgi:hypothetical protein
MAANTPTLYELIYIPHSPSPPSNSSLSLQERCYSYTPIISSKSPPSKKCLEDYISEHLDDYFEEVPVNDFTNSSFPSYSVWCQHCQNPTHSNDECPWIQYSLGLRPYPSDYDLECLKNSYYSWYQSHTNSQSDWSYIDPSQPTLEENLEAQNISTILDQSDPATYVDNRSTLNKCLDEIFNKCLDETLNKCLYEILK